MAGFHERLFSIGSTTSFIPTIVLYCVKNCSGSTPHPQTPRSTGKNPISNPLVPLLWNLLLFSGRMDSKTNGDARVEEVLALGLRIEFRAPRMEKDSRGSSETEMVEGDDGDSLLLFEYGSVGDQELDSTSGAASGPSLGHASGINLSTLTVALATSGVSRLDSND